MRRRRGRTVVLEGIDERRDDESDYAPRDNRFTGRIVRVTIDTKPSQLSAADQKAVEDAADAAAAIED
jgi:arylsulfatase